MTSPTRVNRLALSFLGLLFVAGGAFGLARGFGAFAGLPATDLIVSDQTRSWVAAHHGSFWAAVALIALVVAFLGLVWLRQQLRTTLPANQDVLRVDGAGRTALRAGDAANAVAGQIGQWPGVEDAAARLVGEPERPALLLRVGVAADADVAEICRRVDAEALPDLRRTLELPELDAELELRIRPREGRLVH